MSQEIYYLVESVHVSNTGRITGKTLRAYEVTIEERMETYGYNRKILIPTGIMYSLKGSALIKTSTKATLKNKRFYSYHGLTAHSDPSTISKWSSTLYSSPEVAIIAKSLAITRYANELRQSLETSLQNLQNSISQLPDTSDFLSTHPEYLV
jgi:hypothetical protein